MAVGQGAALDAQMGDQRQGHGNGAASKAGKVVDDRDFFLIVMRHLDLQTNIPCKAYILPTRGIQASAPRALLSTLFHHSGPLQAAAMT